VVLQESDLILKRPLGGINPAVDLVGRRLSRPVSGDTPITEADLA
jgi:hypothetical protein